MRTILGVVAATLLALGLSACKSDTTSSSEKTEAEAKTAAAERQKADNEQGAAKKEADETAESGESSADLATVELSVKEMVCQGCSKAVKSNLEKISGVSKVESSFQENRATVSYDPDGAEPQQFVDALSDVEMNGKEMGWDVKVVGQPSGKAEN